MLAAKEKKLVMQAYADLANAVYADDHDGRISKIRRRFERFSYFFTGVINPPPVKPQRNGLINRLIAAVRRKPAAPWSGSVSTAGVLISAKRQNNY